MLKIQAKIHLFTCLTAIAWISDVFTAVLYLLEPPLLLLRSAEIALDDEPGTFFDQNTQVFSCIIVGIHADKQWFGGQLTGQSEGLSQKSRSAFLAVLFSFTEFLSTRNLSVPM